MEKNKSLPNVSLKEYKSRLSWGLLASVSLYGCDNGLIKDKKAIKKFVIELCKVIKMERYGEPLIERFADGPLEGVSMMQFITTSSITAHFDEEYNRAFLDIFSCKYFNQKQAAIFSKKFFKAKEYTIQTLIRD